MYPLKICLVILLLFPVILPILFFRAFRAYLGVGSFLEALCKFPIPTLGKVNEKL